MGKDLAGIADGLVAAELDHARPQVLGVAAELALAWDMSADWIVPSWDLVSVFIKLKDGTRCSIIL